MTEKLLTAEEFYRLPDPPDGGTMELVLGRVITYVPGGRVHGRTAARLSRFLADFVDAHALGEMHISLGHRVEVTPDTVRAPDVSFMSNARLAGQPEEGFVYGGPTLAVEVTSPGDREPEIRRKVVEYLAAESERVWVVRPEEGTVTVHRDDGSVVVRGAADTLTSDDAGFGVDGLALPVAKLFA